jgi:YHS domain-containing protein
MESEAMARGGARPGAGRKKGKVGEAKRQLAEMAKEHAEDALLTLVEIAKGDAAASARVSAAVAILDRAYGKPTQALEHSTPDNSLSKLMAALAGTSFRPVEFPRMCTMARALGKEVELDSSISVQIDGMTYYFASEDAKANFMKDPEGNLAKARAYRRPVSARMG